MSFDLFVKLIEAADFLSFKEVAFECLKLKGYQELSVTDGWKDGGADLRIYELPPNPIKIAIQITVEKDWKRKVLSDAIKCKNRLHLNMMIFICSRRIPEAEFDSYRDSIFKEQGIVVSRIDSQSIASTFYEFNKTSRLLEVLGIHIDIDKNRAIHNEPRVDAALSFSFFSKDAQSFRELAFESAIISIAYNEININRKCLVQKVVEVLKISDTQRMLIESAVDRLIQRRDLCGGPNELSLNPLKKEAVKAMMRHRALEERELIGDLCVLIKRYSKMINEEGVEDILHNLGALMIDSARNAAESLNPKKGKSSVFNEKIKRGLMHLHSILDAHGVDGGSARDQLLEDIAEKVSDSPLGKHLFSGELFLSMISNNTAQLIKAFGAKQGVKVLLDASVAIPMLCTLLYEVVPNRFSISAKHVYDQLSIHGQKIYLPYDYLEEVSTHLINADRDYSYVVDSDSDLAFSKNSFISHYVTMKNTGIDISFVDYMLSFGYDNKLRESDFYPTRSQLVVKLKKLFDMYGIEVLSLSAASNDIRIKAEESIAYAVKEYDKTRPKILQDHDANLISYLNMRESSNDEVDIVCTWDGLLMSIKEREEVAWCVMNPAVLGDIFAVARGDGYDGRIFSPVSFAKMLTDEASELGAVVLDAIVKIEKDNAHDAKLFGIAKRFKDSYMSRNSSDKSYKKITDEWAKWKAEYYCE